MGAPPLLEPETMERADFQNASQNHPRRNSRFSSAKALGHWKAAFYWLTWKFIHGEEAVEEADECGSLISQVDRRPPSPWTAPGPSETLPLRPKRPQAAHSPSTPAPALERRPHLRRPRLPAIILRTVTVLHQRPTPSPSLRSAGSTTYMSQYFPLLSFPNHPDCPWV